MAAKAYPPHFENGLHFDVYVIDCAIRDRQAYLEAIQKSPGMEQWIVETKAEIHALRRRKKHAETRYAQLTSELKAIQ